MAVQVREFGELLRPRAAAAVIQSPAGIPACPVVERSFKARRNLAVRRRRLQRLQQGLVTAGWVGGSAALLLLAAAGVLGLR